MTLYDDFKSIVLNQTPLLDVRSAVEFSKGAFLNSTNIAIMSDEERHIVGICYKNEGNEKAVELGHKLVSGAIKEARINAWVEFIKNNPSALLYCFRGGQRSKTSQQWLKDNGVNIARLKGGYKAFRSYLLDEINDFENNFKPIILGGRTGSGKTILLNNLSNAIDLEALANHRGSAFGKKTSPQTSQINFENNLAYELIQKKESGFKTLVFEDEGKHIGTVFMPQSFLSALSNAPIVILETLLDERVEITFNEYVIEAQKMYKDYEAWCESIENALLQIKKRLGNERYTIVSNLFKNAKTTQSSQCHKEWIKYLLKEYYDPMYDYQIEKRSSRVVFRGNEEEIKEFLHSSAFSFFN